ncbi:MAG TPA: D-alanine--D-alanine ligase family protein [Pyrinomonadaceae bacterium]|nr:D-alanine--D-alanine ligase family protein [Pyrinomonadaceae bacterium]
MRTRVGVIFGGRSGEHDISVRSAETVVEALDREKYEVIPIAIGRDGRWLGPEQAKSLLNPVAGDLISLEPKFEGDPEIGLIGNQKLEGLTLFHDRQQDPVELNLDVVLPVLHGTFGEDGTIQGLLEMAGVPYVGCGVLASACGMDKVIMKSLFVEAGLPICNYTWFLRSEWEANRASVVDMVERAIGYPCFVKPANLGSSVGISRATDSASLEAAIDLAAEYDRRIIVEEGLKMREIECAILGNDEPMASLPGEYVIKDKTKAFLDYTEKYTGTGNNEFVVPAPVSEELSNNIRQMAVAAFKAIDGSGLARVDFFLRTDTGALLVNEINTMPGLTDASGYPKMWAGTGVSFSELLDRLIALAVERHQDRARNRTSK